MKFHTSVISRIGGGEKNQDYCSFIQNPKRSIWVVSDGLGGHSGGEIASFIAVETILKGFEEKEDISKKRILSLLNFANEKIIQGQMNLSEYKEMKTTIVLLLTDGKTTILANVGDSRGYYFSNGELSLQTKDHSIPQLLTDLGEIQKQEIRTHEDRNKVLNVLGKKKQVEPSIYVLKEKISPGDAFLLCTDGFWELVLEQEMAIDLIKSPTPESWLQKMEYRLLNRMNSKHDNYSAIAITVSE